MSRPFPCEPFDGVRLQELDPARMQRHIEVMPSMEVTLSMPRSQWPHCDSIAHLDTRACVGRANANENATVNIFTT